MALSELVAPLAGRAAVSSKTGEITAIVLRLMTLRLSKTPIVAERRTFV
jgi:hypothetical protein